MPLKPTIKPAPADFNRDPLTGEPGAHPVGADIGAATGAATGASIGMGAGPVGAAIGAVVGGFIGGYAGKGVAEGIDPTAEDAYWRENHPAQSFADDGADYESYASAYRTGFTGYREGRSFAEREADLRMEYEGGPQRSEAQAANSNEEMPTSPPPLKWDKARNAAQAAYERLASGEGGARVEPPATPLPTQGGATA